MASNFLGAIILVGSIIRTTRDSRNRTQENVFVFRSIFQSSIGQGWGQRGLAVGEVETSPHRDEWLMGLQKAVDAILVQPLNSLVRISAARESGTDLADCTVVFTAKTDKATGKLLDDWASSPPR